MIHTERFCLTEGNKVITVLLCVWLLLSSYTNTLAQSYSDEDKYKYPYLADILDVYCNFYLAGPNNVQDLIKFTEVYHTNFSNEFYYYEILNKITIPKLKEYKDQIKIVQNHCEYALLLDSVLLYSYLDFPCCDLVEDYYPEDQPIMIRKRIENGGLFFKKQAPILNRAQLTSNLVREFDIFYKARSVNKERLIFLRYLKGGHLFDYCKAGTDLNSIYYKMIESLLSDFCEKYNVDDVFLYVYCEGSE